MRNVASAPIAAAHQEIIGLITTMLLRCQMHIEVRLAQCDAHGGDAGHVPEDLIKEDWLGRVERISRFLIEVTSMRQRVRHLARLNDEKKNDTNLKGSRVDDSPAETGERQGAPRNGRVHHAKERITFP